MTDELVLDHRRAFERIADVVSGDAGPGPYRKMWEIRQLFEDIGIEPESNHGTRYWFAVESLNALNGTFALRDVLIYLASPREYQGDFKKTQEVIDYLNEMLRLYGYAIQLEGIHPQIVRYDYNAEDTRQLEEHLDADDLPEEFAELGETHSICDNAIQ